MPALKGLAVSCKFVDDAAFASLPDFPALKELVPMDVGDDGFRHIGRSEQLESLILMYCRDTTDVATSHIIVGMPRLKKYHAGYTLITDKSLELLSQIKSLEEISFEGCKFITDAGIPSLTIFPAPRNLYRRLPESNAIRSDRVYEQRASELRPTLKPIHRLHRLFIEICVICGKTETLLQLLEFLLRLDQDWESWSASFQSVKKSWYDLRAWAVSPCIAEARASVRCASGHSVESGP